jgi:hypothetical protein
MSGHERTFAEVQDLRDWVEDSLGEFLTRMAQLEVTENPVVIARIRIASSSLETAGLDILKGLEQLLVDKKKDEPLDPL